MKINVVRSGEGHPGILRRGRTLLTHPPTDVKIRDSRNANPSLQQGQTFPTRIDLPRGGQRDLPSQATPHCPQFRRSRSVRSTVYSIRHLSRGPGFIFPEIPLLFVFLYGPRLSLLIYLGQGFRRPVS